MAADRYWATKRPKLLIPAADTVCHPAMYLATKIAYRGANKLQAFLNVCDVYVIVHSGDHPSRFRMILMSSVFNFSRVFVIPYMEFPSSGSQVESIVVPQLELGSS